MMIDLEGFILCIVAAFVMGMLLWSIYKDAVISRTCRKEFLNVEKDIESIIERINNQTISIKLYYRITYDDFRNIYDKNIDMFYLFGHFVVFCDYNYTNSKGLREATLYYFDEESYWKYKEFFVREKSLYKDTALEDEVERRSKENHLKVHTVEGNQSDARKLFGPAKSEIIYTAKETGSD